LGIGCSPAIDETFRIPPRPRPIMLDNAGAQAPTAPFADSSSAVQEPIG